MKEVIAIPGGKVTVETISTFAADTTTPVNQPPVVNAGTNQSITLPVSTATLKGTASDIDGSIVSSVWSKTSGPNVVIAEPNNLQTAISGLQAGNYTFRLTVTDDKGASVSKDTTLLVNAEVIVIPPVGTPVSFTPTQLTTDFKRFGAGVEQWNGGYDVPVYADMTGIDKYYRFQWYELEKTRDEYTFGVFDGQIREAIDRGGCFSFGIMTCYADAEKGRRFNYTDGSYSAFPSYVHSLMQAESTKDWKHSTGAWVPNWNSEAYLTRLLALHKAMNSYFETATYKGVKYKDVIKYIDIRGYGQWGEWHTVNIVDDASQYPKGTAPTVASLKRIVDAHTQGFPNYPLVAMIAALEAGSSHFGNINNPAEIAYYLLTQKNSWGEIGWRRDQWGATDSYLGAILENNTSSYNGVALKTLIMNKWKVAMIVGEPSGESYEDMRDMVRQVKLYHPDSFGNGNYGNYNMAVMSANIKAASKLSGYWLTITGGVMTGNTITINWSNLQSPIKENCEVYFEIHNGSTITTLPKSSFNPKFFTGTKSVTDTFQSIPAGTLYVVIKDAKGYRKPLQLAIGGKQADGSYLLK